MVLIVPLGAVLSNTGFTSWFGGQGIGSDCVTWCCAVFIQGLHLGLEDTVLVVFVPLGAVLSYTGLTSWFGGQGIGSECVTWCRAV